MFRQPSPFHLEPPAGEPPSAMTHLDLFLQKGPANGDLTAGLEELRRTILLDGIPSNNDGMVSSHARHS